MEKKGDVDDFFSGLRKFGPVKAEPEEIFINEAIDTRQFFQM